ncbi:MAG TPA: hypothetical protein VIL86_07050 [Tepidisphaeraceae bacterium]|jgi:hypothetical protein
MALIDDLRRTLREHFPDATIKLAHYGDRIGGSLVWHGFQDEAQIDRQLRLRKAVTSLPAQEQLKVSFILTLTPNEHASILKAS